VLKAIVVEARKHVGVNIIQSLSVSIITTKVKIVIPISLTFGTWFSLCVKRCSFKKNSKK
jgi:hypothetical protein